MVNNEVTLNPGDRLSFIARSSPSGTPWARYASNVSTAQQSLGELQQITLSPTQTQVTLSYDKTKPVASDTSVVISLNTLVVPGNATTVTATLKAPQAAAASAGTPAIADSDLSFGTLSAKQPNVYSQLAGLPVNAGEDAIKAALKTHWKKICGADFSASDEQELLDSTFLQAVENGSKPNSNQPFCN